MSADFTDNGDGTVTHKRTNLTWKRCAEGQTWTGATCSGTATGYPWGMAKALESGEWRLPKVSELLTIAEWGNTRTISINNTEKIDAN